MRAVEYLDQIKKIDVMIKNKSEEYRRLVNLASGQGDFSILERVMATRDPQRIPEAIARYIDIEREIKELNRKREEIIATVERLSTVEYEIIYDLFVNGCTLKEVAYRHHRSYEWTIKKKRQALAHLEKILNP